MESEKTKLEIALAREGYRTAATRGSLIYFVIADLANIDPMYQYSLVYFQQLFRRCITNSEPSPDLAVRLRTLIDYTTEACYINICRGIFERHKALCVVSWCWRVVAARAFC